MPNIVPQKLEDVKELIKVIKSYVNITSDIFNVLEVVKS